MSNIHGLGKAPAKENPKAKDKKTEEFSVGGGQQVVRPTHNAGREFVDDVMASSREHNTNSTGGPSVGEITIYANGFQIGTQEFRSLNEGPNQEQNKAFLAALQRREVPSELDKEIVAEYGPAVEEVGITIVNRSQETFTPPKEKFSFSKSQGQSLVSEKDEQAKNTVLQAFSDAKPLKLENNTEPGNYTIQIVLHDRSRSRLTISPSTTVFAIYQHVMAISNITTSFQLIAGFPPVPLTNPSATAEQAKLKNASITQKL